MLLPSEASRDAVRLSQALRVTVTFADLLHRRGYGDGELTRRFLDPKLAHLTPPQSMAGRPEAIARIVHAIRKRERIVVFGDYDCDGVTSVAILLEVIRALHGDVKALLADRFDGGYGLSDQAVDAVLAAGPSLLVTCDCGSSDHERLARLARHGVDTVVLDHHLVPDEPLPAVAFLNPKRADCPFPFKHLASCGLALSLAAGLRAELDPRLDVRNWLDLVAIGTIADMVPLEGDNRALVRAGMRLIEQAKRPGIKCMADYARVTLQHGVTAETVAFELAPRLNAPGRMGSAMAALDLLLARDPGEAQRCAAVVEAARTERRRVQDQILQEALDEVKSCGYDRDPAIVLGREGWHPGVVGIVAAHLVERFGKPSVVIGFRGETGRGSVRGPEGISVYELLQASREAPVKFGGHHAAAGVTIAASALSRLRDLFNAATAAQLRLAEGKARGGAGAEVQLHDSDAPIDVVRDLDWLEPCGLGNEAPRLAIAKAKVARAQSVRGGHLQVQLAVRDGTVLYGFGRSMGARAHEWQPNQQVNVVGTLRRDAFRGGAAVGMMVYAIDAV